MTQQKLRQKTVLIDTLRKELKTAQDTISDLQLQLSSQPKPKEIKPTNLLYVPAPSIHIEPPK
jgi:hypothetical protein